MGVPAPELMAPAIMWLELIGGVLLIIGVATRIVGILFALNMLGAIALVHGSAGFLRRMAALNSYCCSVLVLLR